MHTHVTQQPARGGLLLFLKLKTTTKVIADSKVCRTLNTKLLPAAAAGCHHDSLKPGLHRALLPATVAYTCAPKPVLVSPPVSLCTRHNPKMWAYPTAATCSACKAAPQLALLPYGRVFIVHCSAVQLVEHHRHTTTCAAWRHAA
jgi:hypothetical protein